MELRQHGGVRVVAQGHRYAGKMGLDPLLQGLVMESKVIGVQHQLAVRGDAPRHRDANALQRILPNARFPQHGPDLLGDDGCHHLPAPLEGDAFLRQQLPLLIQ